MFRKSGLLAAAVILSACQADTFYAEGVSIASRDQDLARCNGEAHQSYPPNIVTRYRPRMFHAGGRVCNAAGICQIVAPYWTGGEAYRVDINEDLREDTVTACMARRGYTLISLPNCSLDGTVAASTSMAPLTAQTCLIPRQSGGALVVNP